MLTIICNSPPQSGKDTFVKYLAKLYYEDTIHLEFKSKLIDLTCQIYSISRKQWDEIYTSELKETPMEMFEGRSPREALIHISEEVIKPAFGNDFFGKAAAKQLQNNKINLFSDGGFYDEIIQVVNAVGKENTLILEFKREGCNFKKDSRTNISIDGVDRYVFDNNGSHEALYEFANGVYDIVSQGRMPTMEELSELEVIVKRNN